MGWEIGKGRTRQRIRNRPAGGLPFDVSELLNEGGREAIGPLSNFIVADDEILSG